MSRYPLDENDLIDFLNEGPKVGEQIFREKFGYCPRGLLRILVGTILHKYKVGNLVAYQMINENFITENSEFIIDTLSLDDSEGSIKIDDIEMPRNRRFSDRLK